ncbi:MAG: hypothetical protein JO144_16150 [Actinobacteria bacterium]|nr:hypothetical protein [Actinomycetota bacterium]
MVNRSAPRSGGWVGALLAAVVLTGCTQASVPGGGASSTVASTPTSSAPPSAGRTTSATPSAVATGEPSLGGRCEDLLSVGTVNIALRRTVIGRTAFVLGVAEPDIGRLTYLNCRYGIPAPVKGKPAPQPQVEVGISLYHSPAQAARRIQATIEYYRAHGAGDRPASVGTVQGTMLSGYGMPTLVAAAGPRTVAVSVSPKLLSAGSTAGLAALAKAALDASAHYTLGSAAATGASPSTTG